MVESFCPIMNHSLINFTPNAEICKIFNMNKELGIEKWGGSEKEDLEKEDELTREREFNEN